MAYSIYIERSRDSKSGTLSLEDWLDFVAMQQDLSLIEEVQLQTPYGLLSASTPHGAEWLQHPQMRRCIFLWSEQSKNIVLDAPDTYAIAKAKQIATALECVVVSMEGELY